jgi:uncharacterized alkaline shock family protein YloU
MIDIKSKKCIHKGCNVKPCFNKEGEKKALYCSSHKLEGMINIKSKRCIHEGCKIRSTFNKEGETKPLYCLKHKLEGMVNIVSQTCIHEGCKKIPAYNQEGETKGVYCAEHKKEMMVDVITPTCIQEGCKIRPYYNKEGETKGIYCSLHKTEGMIDVKNKTCIEYGCKKQRVYNNAGERKGIYCSEHKKEGMLNVISQMCIHEGCKIRPAFNKEGESKGIYCSVHKKEGMVNVISPTCKTYLCSTIVQGKYDGYCLRCFIHLFPDKPVSRNYKTKEYAVVEYIKQNYPHLNWIADKIISGGCSKRRPDLLLDLGYQVIIIEIDENQHIDYDCSCENKRTMELSQDMGHRPIIFIRFNPDDYMKNETKITSCWGQDNKGICVVKKSKKSEWTERLVILKQTIDYWINPVNITNKTIETIQLFYDI